MSEYHDFNHFGLDPQILAAITEMGYTTPTPIQSKAIPIVLKGGDVMGAAQTGTGKTAGFGLPMLQRLMRHASTSVSPARHPVRGLVLTPTRELADQVADNLRKYASKCPLRVAMVYGGVDMRPQTEALRAGVEILIATPGRLLDHIEQKNTSLSQVEIVVLDEADRMLDMGFLPDISRILNFLPKQRQSLMFSATFSEEIKRLAANFLNAPVLVEVARRNATADTVTQEVLRVHESEKTDALLQLLKTRGPDGGRLTQVLVFVNAKIECRRLARQLQKAGVNADAIHGDKTQDERMKALEGFKDGTIEVLVATDVAARGLDIAELPVVINYDVPFQAEDYIHRIGRTGRAGASGLAIMMMTGADERGVAAIEKLTKQHFERAEHQAERRDRRDRPEHGERAQRSERPERTERPERSERTERPERRERAERSERAPARSGSADPFFSQPYEPSGAGGAAGAQAPAPSTPERKPARTSALLGGLKR
ncbi:MAG TPA: DEAD/DEAH box helicase [Burkholderiaceae bacterium]|jgi:superfamily II DNA/RNA helicase|nr:DEAD/DEAH box helicase [Burkholderiaceae bacterium]HPE00440.1 DEAD/DEAH box helicase [Burkholderiaceae bacterium]HRZ00194.1 DEAD/DEAH box helicase [Burkholderiaceae bacterium]